MATAPARQPFPVRRLVAIASRVSVAVLVLALVSAGVLGAVRYGVTFWLYRGFAAPSAPTKVLVRVKGVERTRQVASAALQQITVTSRALGGWPDPVVVLLPPGYARHPQQRYPVLYLLHGSPGGPLNFIGVADLIPTYEVLLAERRIHPMIVVMPSGSTSFLADSEWANWVLPDNAWETFVAHDLVDTIDARYRTIRSQRARAIGGLSEGGYGALNIALHHPREFSVIESWSGYMKAYNMVDVFGRRRSLLAYNSPAIELPRVAATLRARHVFIWTYWGNEDPYRFQNIRFARELRAMRIRHQSLMLHARHSWALWRKMIGQALVVASRHFGHG